MEIDLILRKVFGWLDGRSCLWERNSAVNYSIRDEHYLEICFASKELWKSKIPAAPSTNIYFVLNCVSSSYYLAGEAGNW